MLAGDFTESELRSAINQMPTDKVPGPDGFTGLFFKECCNIIKGDVMNVANAFHQLRTSNLAILNTTNVVLIPKKDGADSVSYFRPISLIHSFAKIIAKVLAMPLAPHMNSLVSKSQSTFIKKRSIHDNFMSVRCAVRRFHRSKTPALFFKLDITKAFDSVHWQYLLTMMSKLSF